ncbi:MAG: hypothetical protein H0T42_05030 [Deltaproteobacteria bacterium]|nr:hypothetical protein [Deltaproteobacteria bacterium]
MAKKPPASKSKKTTKKPAPKKVAANKPAAKKPAAKKPAAKKPAVKSAAKKPAAKPAAKPKREAVETAAAPKRPAIETLGSITCPSGKLAIFDIGLVGFLPRGALEPQIVRTDVPRDRELTITGSRVGRGRFADCWDHVSVNLADGDVHQSKKLGDAGVDFARLACLDLAALDHWKHEDSLDGLADVVFWGRDDAALAKALKAPKSKEGYGWRDLDLMDAESKVMEAEILKAENDWMLNVDFRPHSHHFHALAAARVNPAGAGGLEVGGSKMLLFFTSWGDGVFPIYLDLDAEDRPVRVRIQLSTAESNAAIDSVNS